MRGAAHRIHIRVDTIKHNKKDNRKVVKDMYTVQPVYFALVQGRLRTG